MVFLQETHSSDVGSMKWATQLSQYFCYFSHGTTASRGTAVLVHKRLVFDVLQDICDTQGRYVILKGYLFGNLVTFGSIYAPADGARERDIFFDELIGLNLGNVHYIFGDFNSVLDGTLDRINGSFGGDPELVRFCEDSGSIEAWRELNHDVREFSYARHPINGPFSRIDMCMVSTEAIGTVKEAFYIDSFHLSDHSWLKVKIEFGQSIIGFDFKKIKPNTIKSDLFKNKFLSFWEEVVAQLGMQVLEKIENGSFVGDLRVAREEIVGDFDITKGVLYENIEINGQWWDDFKGKIFDIGRSVQKSNKLESVRLYRESMQEFLACPPGEQKAELEAKIKENIRKIGEEDWFKAKIEQRATFEKSSGAFFRTIRTSKKKSFIDKLNVGGNVVLKDVNLIKSHLVGKYQQLYSKKVTNANLFSNFDQYIPKIQKDQQITGDISLQEIKKVVFRMAIDKCPGADGIPVEFYQIFWGKIGPLLVKLFKNAQPLSWDTAILKLIPKGEDGFSFDNLRPLSLLNVDRKIKAGVWADRMAIVTPPVINRYQTGGVRGRCVQATTLLIHLLIQFQKQQGNGGYVVSLDNAKAYDNINREFMWYILEKYGFSSENLDALKAFHNNNSAKIVVNGFFTQIFDVKFGIRQGCPLSGLLYVLVVEPLSEAIRNANSIKGFVLPNNSEIKLVQHVDDMTLFMKNEISIRNALKGIEEYSSLAGSKLNYGKSFIIKICMQNEESYIEGIKVLKNQCKESRGGGKSVSVFTGEFRKILGIFYCANVKAYVYKNWFEVFKKCQKEVELWQKEKLSLIGRVLVLNVKVLPKTFYIMQSLETMRFWSDRFQTLFKNFIWNHSSNRVPLTVLEWGRDRGGLGLISIEHKARSLRFNNVKSFINDRSEGGIRDLTAINSILGYYLDIPVRSRHRHMITRTGQRLYDHISSYKIIDRRNARKLFFQFILEDIEKITKIESAEEDVFFWSSNKLYKKLVGDSADFICTKNWGFIKATSLGFSDETLGKIWRNVFMRSLAPKVQSFNFKVVHGILPTMQVMAGSQRFRTPWCMYCRHALGIFRVESDFHIFVECHIARVVWQCINDKLVAASLQAIEINRDTIFHKIGLNSGQVHFVSEVTYALWGARCKQVYEEVEQSHTAVLKKIRYILDLNSKIDAELFNARTYKNRWLGLNQAIEALE